MGAEDQSLEDQSLEDQSLEDQSLEDQSLEDQSLAHLPSPLLNALMFACFAFGFVCRLYKITLIISVNNLFSFSRM